MSNYQQPTKHPETGRIEVADWLDDFFGRHRYGVRFPDGKVFRASEVNQANEESGKAGRMRQPKRIQRRRVKGWRLPYGATCVTRPGRWGNPYKTAAEFRVALEFIDRASVLDVLEATFSDEHMQHMIFIHQNAHKLKGFDLACWCPLDAECHADALLEMANR